jgi:hypothetical protein
MSHNYSLLILINITGALIPTHIRQNEYLYF